MVKVDLKFEQKARKINVKDFILFSVGRTIPITWNTFSFVQTNCSCFVKQGLAKRWRQELISCILADKNEEIFSLSTIAILFKLKKYKHNRGTAACNLYSRNLLKMFQKLT